MIYDQSDLRDRQCDPSLSLSLSLCLDEPHISGCLLWLHPFLQTRGGTKKKVSITSISIHALFFPFSLILHSILRVSHILLINVNMIIDINMYEIWLGILWVDWAKKPIVPYIFYCILYSTGLYCVLILQDAGLLPVLRMSVHQPFTMFWPTDEALNSLPAERQRWLSSPDHQDLVAALVKAHIIRNSKVGGGARIRRQWGGGQINIRVVHTLIFKSDFFHIKSWIWKVQYRNKGKKAISTALQTT